MTEQYVTQERCDKHHLDINTKLDHIYRGLFIDNGNPCHQTRLDRHDRMLALMVWISGVLCVAVIAQMVNFGFKVFSEHGKAKTEIIYQERK